MKVLVTGGAGYIGSHTCVALIEDGHEITIVDDFSNSNPEAIKRMDRLTNKKIKYYNVDLLDYNNLENVFKTDEFDSIIHFAGLKAVGESVAKPIEYYNVNVTGTLNLLKLMKKYNVKKIIFSSSATVYGDPAKVPILETDKTASPTSPYGSTKLVIEWILKDVYTSDNDFDITVLRYFNPIGAHKSGDLGEDPKGIPNNLTPYISQVAIGKLKELSIFGNDYDTVDGTGVRDFIHVTDLADGHVKALNNINNSGYKIYNLGTGYGISVLQMVEAFKKASGKEIPYKIMPRRLGDIGECYADSSNAEKELGFKAKKTLEEMCEDTWRWQLKNPNGYN